MNIFLRGELSGIHHFWFIKHIPGAEACHSVILYHTGRYSCRHGKLF